MKRLKIFLLIFTVFSIVNFSACGGGGGGGGGDSGGTSSPPPTTSSDAAAAVEATIDTTTTSTALLATTNLQQNLPANVSGEASFALSQVGMANGLITMVQSYQALALTSTPQQASQANASSISAQSVGNSWTWTATSGGMTIIFQMSETASQTYTWSLTVDGNGYSNYSLASGDLNRDTTTFSGRAAWHMTFNIRPNASNPLLFLFGNFWHFDDGSFVGYWDLNYLGIPYYITVEYSGAYYYWGLWKGTYGGVSTKIVEGGIYLTLGDGWGRAYCESDLQLDAEWTFSNFGASGTACDYVTACDDTDDGCGSWP